MSDEFEVKVDDLSNGSHVLVEVRCDGCMGYRYFW